MLELGLEAGIEFGIELGIELGIETGIEFGIETGIELGVEATLGEILDPAGPCCDAELDTKLEITLAGAAEPKDDAGHFWKQSLWSISSHRLAGIPQAVNELSFASIWSQGGFWRRW